MSTSATLTAPANVLAILRLALIDKTGLTLVGTLDRKDYESVNKFLLAAGAIWNKKAKRHLFSTPEAHAKITGLLENGTVRDDKKYFQAFYTPEDIANEMVYAADMDQSESTCVSRNTSFDVLDPSAGSGRLLIAAKKGAPSARLTAIEIDAAQHGLVTLADQVYYRDFLECDSTDGIGRFDRILINPPYAALNRIGPQDIAHILHARKFLKPGGKLVALCANGPKQKTALKPLATFWKPLPAGAFGESGTNVSTVMLVIEGVS